MMRWLVVALELRWLVVALELPLLPMAKASSLAIMTLLMFYGTVQ